MKIKPGVKLDGLHVSMRIVLTVVENIYRKHNQESVITSGLDGKHSLGSYHRFGMALDYRTRFFKSDEESLEVAEEIRQKLGNKYTVVFEGDHIHTQYNWGKF